jgi:hypothetical protein
VTAIDEELQIQHDSCQEMQDTINTMRSRLRALRQRSANKSEDPESAGQPPA